MATRIVIAVASTEGGGASQEFLVKETYDQGLEKIVPLAPPTSQLQGRESCTWELEDGRRLFCAPQNVCWMEEEAADE